jgi:hypothetical protein
VDVDDGVAFGVDVDDRAPVRVAGRHVAPVAEVILLAADDEGEVGVFVHLLAQLAAGVFADAAGFEDELWHGAAAGPERDQHAEHDRGHAEDARDGDEEPGREPAGDAPCRLDAVHCAEVAVAVAVAVAVPVGEAVGVGDGFVTCS